MEWPIFKRDLQYIFLNSFTNRIPCWTIRKLVYKLCGMKIGIDARIGIYTIIISPRKISIGQRSIVNEYCHLDGSGGITIGDNVSLSAYSKILTSSHYVDSEIFEYYTKEVLIEHNVWIGANACILDGSILKKRSLIAAACVFKGTANENTIYYGNPSKILKERNLSKDYSIDYHPYFR